MFQLIIANQTHEFAADSLSLACGAAGYLLSTLRFRGNAARLLCARTGKLLAVASRFDNSGWCWQTVAGAK